MGRAIRFPDKDLPEKSKWMCLLPSLERRGAFQLLRQLLTQSQGMVSGSGLVYDQDHVPTILILNLVALYKHECKPMIEKKCELFAVFMLILKLSNFQVLFYSNYSFSVIKNGFFVFH